MQTRRPRKALIISLLLGGIALAAIIFVIIANSGVSPVPSAARTAAGTVGSEGFTLTLDGVTVTGDAGVAPVGTEVRAELQQNVVPDLYADFATVSGEGVAVVLGDGIQPSTPIRISFTREAIEDGSSYFLLAQNDSAPGGAELVYAQWNADTAALDGTTSHLSWFQPIAIVAQQVTEKVAKAMSEFMGLSTSEPECNAEPTSSGADVEITPDPKVAWVCVDDASGETTVSLYSNDALVWDVLSQPSASYGPETSTNIAGIITIALSHQMARQGDAVVVPQSRLDLAYPEWQGETTVSLKTNPGLSQIAALVFGISILLPKEILAGLAKAECLVTIAESPSSDAAELTRDVISCAAGAVAGVLGGLISIVLGAPGLLISQLKGIGREVTGTNQVSFFVRTSGGPGEAPPAESPVDQESVGGLLIPAGACTGWEGSRPIQLSGGQGENFDDEESGTGILETELVGSVDLTGDGLDDLVVSIECTGTPAAHCCVGRSSISTAVIALDLSGTDPTLIGGPINGGDPTSYNGDNGAGIGASRLEGTDILTSESAIYPEQLTPDEVADLEGWFRHTLVNGEWTRERE